MNYNPLFDYWFSNWWLCWLIPIIAYFGTMFLWAKRTQVEKDKEIDKGKNKKKAGWPFITFAIVFPLLFFMLNGQFNPSYFGYGTPDAIKDIQYFNGNLYVLDYIKSSGGKSTSGHSYYRIHVIDAKTGVKKRRFIVGINAKLKIVDGEKVGIEHRHDFTYYSNITGEVIEKYSEKTLPKLYPEFSMGVDKLYLLDNNHTMEINTKDGNEWELDLLTNKIIPHRDYGSLPHNPTYALSIDHEDIEVDDTEDRGPTELISIVSRGSNGQKRKIFDRKDSVMLNGETFLMGVPIGIYAKDSLFVVKHYETTESENFILTGVDLVKNKKLWVVKQRDLKPGVKIKYSDDLKFDYDVVNGLLFFNIRKEVFCLNMMDGKIIWQVKL